MTCFRPHVWGFFFHTGQSSLKLLAETFSSPCLGILFSLHLLFLFMDGGRCSRFRPHVWGFFFHITAEKPVRIASRECVFVPMFGDSFFTGTGRHGKQIIGTGVFVPMFGDSFFTRKSWQRFAKIIQLFSSPCLGILFSQCFGRKITEVKNMFSSPCLGILFSLATFAKNYPINGCPKFSSPCLGILFSQQAWGAPRDGLSMALLRRGFPIDWNSHYFHPLTYCFLRFHAYRRGFLLL